MKYSVYLAALLLLQGCISTNSSRAEYDFNPDFSYATLVNLHYKQSDSALGQRYESELVAAHNKVWPTFAKQCREILQREGLESLELVFVVGSDGKVVHIRPEKNGPAADCFMQGIEAIHYPSPPLPYPFWYELVKIS